MWLFVIENDRTATEDVCNIWTVDICNHFLESSDFISGCAVQRVKIEIFWSFAMLRPNEITNLDQPCSTVTKLGPGNFLEVSKGKGSHHWLYLLTDLHGEL